MSFASGAVLCQLRMQKCVIFLMTKAEYIGITEGDKELLWMQKFLQELDMKQEKIRLYCDSINVIYFSNNPTLHSTLKHIDAKYH